MEFGAEVGDLRELDVVRVHGLDHVGPAQVEPPGVIGLGKALLEAVQPHRGEYRVMAQDPEDMDNEDLVIAEPAR